MKLQRYIDSITIDRMVNGYVQRVVYRDVFISDFERSCEPDVNPDIEVTVKFRVDSSNVKYLTFADKKAV